MSEPAAKMNEVVRGVHPVLRGRSFKKQRHAFARDLTEGITHAIQFEMGRYEPHPDRRPGYYYGAFRVEMGVYVEAIAKLLGESRPRFVRAYDCHFREWPRALLDREDTWWTLDQPLRDLAEGMTELVEEVALPWLDRLDSVDGILAAWHSGELRTAYVSEVTVAILHYAGGDQEAAVEMLRTELGRTDHVGAAENLVALSQRLGFGLSMDDANVVKLLEAERQQRA